MLTWEAQLQRAAVGLYWCGASGGRVDGVGVDAVAAPEEIGATETSPQNTGTRDVGGRGQMLLKEIELPAWFLPAMTAHELMAVPGHNLFPAF